VLRLVGLGWGLLCIDPGRCQSCVRHPASFLPPHQHPHHPPPTPQTPQLPQPQPPQGASNRELAVLSHSCLDFAQSYWDPSVKAALSGSEFGESLLSQLSDAAGRLAFVHHNTRAQTWQLRVSLLSSCLVGCFLACLHCLLACLLLACFCACICACKREHCWFAWVHAPSPLLTSPRTHATDRRRPSHSAHPAPSLNHPEPSHHPINQPHTTPPPQTPQGCAQELKKVVRLLSPIYYATMKRLLALAQPSSKQVRRLRSERMGAVG